MWKQVETKEEQAMAFHIRKEVFVEEQGVSAEIEIDQYEAAAKHILIYYEQQPVGTGRVRVVGDTAKLERICILAPYRKYGLGKELVSALESIAKAQGIRKAKLHGQTQVEAFYQKLGYQTRSGVFMEDGIPHVQMGKVLDI